MKRRSSRSLETLAVGVVTASLLLVACKQQSPDAPLLRSVTPSSGPSTSTTRVTMAGRFNPVLTVDYDSKDQTRLRTDFRARLGEKSELVEMLYKGSSELEGTVPSGLTPGVYDLSVADPRGRTGTLPQAFTVTGPGDGGGSDGRRDGRADAHDGRADVRRGEGKSPDGVVPSTFITLAAATFIMGSPMTEPCRAPNETQHQVTLTHAFEISKTEVTQDQFQKLSGYNPSAAASCGGTCPVESVSWHEAINYCNQLSVSKGLAKCFTCSAPGPGVACTVVAAYAAGKIYQCPGYRLPTEAEWEYAYRAGTTTALYNGPITATCISSDPLADLIAWYKTSSPHLVGTKQPNAWGLYDMAGNVWEWTSDLEINDLGSSPVTDPSGAATGTNHIYRGGSWYFGLNYVRAAYRAGWNEANRRMDTGFRCARSKIP